MFCLAGLGGHIESMIASAKAARRVVAVDGCGVACARETLQHAGFEVTDHVVVTELGIQKQYDLTVPEAEVEKVAKRVRESLGAIAPTVRAIAAMG